MENNNMEKIHNFLLLDGRMLKFKFGYADSNGEYYTNFTDASKANNGKGVKYGAFLTVSDGTDPCWEFDSDLIDYQADRELTEEEKSKVMFKCYVYLMKIQHGEDAAFELVSELYKRINYDNEN